ncbi:MULTISPECIES: ABC transporter permease [Ensifer]|uniref:ABC transporter permease n=1 Tax=Ensifer TaxID=106591 RepID=UPI00070AB2BD|nr:MULTISPECIES: ABC transporter permease [Ensifer]KQW62050.1 ABC transporter permease [Ensifer sp. Root1252]KQW82158.1 ABC transporter permease [Ensifer sp. Root127]KRC83203.1 ABC transporter permease [Ensifer sp. Root231]KRC85076.1 ABC transporter permease [Ensifer sp. Root258]NOV17444.1 ABC transporter permease [Ensifer canadensis]
MDWTFLQETFVSLVSAVPLTLLLAANSIAFGAILAVGIAVARFSAIAPLRWLAQAYVFVFRGTPLLVQIFIIYYGLSQFPAIRHSLLWPVLREPYWCAVLALALNTAAYASEIVRGGLLSVPFGQVEAARACGMSRFMIFRRITLPLGVRQALPGYGNEMISMVKATSLASIITLMEVTGVAARIISESYRAIEVFVVAGAIYLTINFLLTRLVQLVEFRLSPHLRQPVAVLPAIIEGEAH